MSRLRTVISGRLVASDSGVGELVIVRQEPGRACAEPASRPSAARSGGGAEQRALTAASARVTPNRTVVRRMGSLRLVGRLSKPQCEQEAPCVCNRLRRSKTAPARSGAVSDGPPRQRSIHVVKGPDRGKSSSAAGGESVHSGTGADLYVRWSNVAANPNVTSGERTYRQGSDRPCAGLRWPRTANPASGQSLHLPSALYDAHPLWRTPKIWTVHRHQGREPACERCRRDDGTARRSTASVAGTGADDDPSSRRRPFRSPSRSHVQPPPLPVPRSATALRKRPRTDVRSAWSSASSESGLNRPAFISISARCSLTRGAHGLVMRRRTARFPPVLPRCRAWAGRATRTGSVRAGRWPAGGACA